MITTKVYAEHDDLALVPTIRALPDGEIAVVSEAGTDPVHEAYFFRIAAPDFEAVEAALAEDDTVSEFTTIVETDEERTYRVEYSEDTKLLTPIVTDIGGFTLSAEGHANGWLLELQMEDNEGLYELSEYANEEGIHLEVLEIRQTDGSWDRLDFGLTGSQRKTLLAAFVHGYYDEPREMSLVELAELLEISPTAVSGRLRRGSARLIEEVLIDEDDRRA